mmetsp:Transcript_28563/g.59704  ORF Transcript_28563/g.59704 Transcript_28563/m.59704 type:complete len:319 (+) Transcript_28563:160-1116(+)
MASGEQDVSESDSDLVSLNSSQASSTRCTATNKIVRRKFSAWTFQLTISADATALNGGRDSYSVPLHEQKKRLLEHVQSRILNTMPQSFTFVSAFYNVSILSVALPGNIPVSIPFRGYVQSRAHKSCGITTVQKWIPSASWNPVPGGLASNPEFKADVTRSRTPNDQWTEMIVFGGLSLNNQARSEKKQIREEAREAEAAQLQAAKRPALSDVTNRPQRAPSRPASDTSSSRGSTAESSSSSYASLLCSVSAGPSGPGPSPPPRAFSPPRRIRAHSTETSSRRSQTPGARRRPARRPSRSRQAPRPTLRDRRTHRRSC